MLTGLGPSLGVNRQHLAPPKICPVWHWWVQISRAWTSSAHRRISAFGTTPLWHRVICPLPHSSCLLGGLIREWVVFWIIFLAYVLGMWRGCIWKWVRNGRQWVLSNAKEWHCVKTKNWGWGITSRSSSLLANHTSLWRNQWNTPQIFEGKQRGRHWQCH